MIIQKVNKDLVGIGSIHRLPEASFSTPAGRMNLYSDITFCGKRLSPVIELTEAEWDQAGKFRCGACESLYLKPKPDTVWEEQLIRTYAFKDLLAKNAELSAKNERLSRFIIDYSFHKPNCSTLSCPESPCDCGLNATFAALSPDVPESEDA